MTVPGNSGTGTNTQIFGLVREWNQYQFHQRPYRQPAHKPEKHNSYLQGWRVWATHVSRRPMWEARFDSELLFIPSKLRCKPNLTFSMVERCRQYRRRRCFTALGKPAGILLVTFLMALLNLKWWFSIIYLTKLNKCCVKNYLKIFKVIPN